MAEALLHALLRSSAELSLALLIVLVLRPLLRRGFGAASAYAAWWLVPLLLVVAQLPASRPGVMLHQLVVTGPPSVAAVVVPVETDAEPLVIGVLAVWAIGAMTLFMLLARRHRRFVASLRLDAAADRWIAPAGNGPALVGLLRPRLCLPEDFTQRYTPAQQALILAHEDVHRRRGDNAWNLLTAALCALQWFNPIVWWAARSLRADQELSCDEAVLRQRPHASADYAHALLQAQGLSPQGLPWASWRSSHPLVERIAMLKNHAHARRRGGLAAIAIAALLGAGAVHAVQSDQSGPVKAADVKLDISLEFSATKDGKLDRWQVTTSVAVPNNAETRLHLPLHAAGEPGDEIELIASAAPYGDAPTPQWKISTEIRQGNPAKVLSKPRMITADGKQAVIETGERGRDNEVIHMIRIGITPTRLHPQAKL